MIWNLCIRRPVLTIVTFLILAIFGIFGYLQMPVRENPDVEFPIVSVNVVLAGAEPEVIETEVLDPLEEEINTVEGLKTLTSTAREQVGTVTAEFELWRDIDIAAQDVRDRVNRARRQLPEGVEEPIILLTLPLALVGAFGALFVLDMPFGIIAFIGLIMLTGMATKNAILMIDYTNRLIAEGSGVLEGAKKAAHIRFRPVIMTTISTVLGLMPIALGFGADGEARAPMGVAVAAGLTATTLLTLIVIPVVYALSSALWMTESTKEAASASSSSEQGAARA